MTWTVIIAIGAATYALRASFLVSPADRTMPAIERYLRFVPVAVLPALATSAVLGGESGVDGARVGAALIGALVAWRTRSATAVMVTGMLALWALQAALS